MQIVSLLVATAAPAAFVNGPSIVQTFGIQNYSGLHSTVAAGGWLRPTHPSVRSLVESLGAGVAASAGLVPGQSAASSVQIECREPASVVKALGRLRTIGKWSDNWDGEGGLAPDSGAIESATLLLGFINSVLGMVPNVGLNADGCPSLTFFNDDLEIAFTLNSQSEVEFFAARGDHIRGGLANFDGKSLPVEIISAVTEIRDVVG